MTRPRTFVSTVIAFAVLVGLSLQGPGVVAQSAGAALQLNGTNQYVTFGSAPGLGAATFTLELWFKRTAAGVATSTGTGGIASAVPLLTKGRGENENSNVDMNYFFGIDLASSKLVADFEEGVSSGGSPGLNHPVSGNTVLTMNTWYHAAATYDGQTWKLYLNGVEDGSLSLTAPRPPRADSIQHAAIGTAMTSTGLAAGFFAGVVDEARVWNVARTAAQIQASRTQEIPPTSGLIGHWSMNENAGTSLTDSSGFGVNGTLVANPTWVTSGAFDIDPPAAPQNVSGSPGKNLATLAWVPNTEADIAGYNVYRSQISPVATTGSPLNLTPLTIAIYTDTGLTNGVSYYYAVKAVDTSGNRSAASAEAVVTPDANAGAALQFNGSNQYVTFGVANGLGTATFTLETWFKRTGAGAGTNTGSGGIPDVIPLVSKGRAEAEGSNVDMNYVLGIQAATGLLAADFEDTASGANHPVLGITPIPVSTTTWHHAAATYDGSSWRLYLDGTLESTLSTVNAIPRADSIQHAGIGTAFSSTGVPLGFFAGIQDEVRIWNYARTQAEIQSTMQQELTSAAGLLGRWGLNEAAGATANNSVATINGTLVGSPGWVAGYPFAPDTTAPAVPQNLVANGGNQTVQVSWTPNTEADLAGYNLYRSTTTPVAIATPLNGSSLLTLPSFTDNTVVNGTTYYYAVTASDIFGNVSGASSEASATPRAANQVPVVNAGNDQAIALPDNATLAGAASDPDGSPSPLTVTWSKQSGPSALVTFANANSPSTTATFVAAGTYVLRLSASDGAATTFDDVTITVSDPILVGAGDIVPDCKAGQSTADAQATATLLDSIPGTVFTLGDNAYQDGTVAQFTDCYGPTWGRHKARTRPATGNHDYHVANATPYFDYFNGEGNQSGNAGDRSGGYYSYDIGAWHVVVLNSECASSDGLWQPGGCAVGSAQEQWLRADLAASATNNIIAMWHKPRFSSTQPDATNAFMQPLWQALYEGGADIIMGGHWHNYERLAPTDANGLRDDSFGIRQFIVGTGGIPIGGFGTTRGTSEVRNSDTHGVIKLTLHATSYDWSFIPIAGDTFAESGTSPVHSAPPAPAITAISPTGGPAAGGTPITISGANFGVLTPTSVTFGGTPATSVSCASATQCTATSPAGTGVVDVRVTVGGRTSAVVTADRFSFNQAPVVNAGSDLAITLPASANLAGTMTDDGLPNPPGALTAAWSKVSGPGSVTFGNAAALSTTAAFSQSGTYVLRLAGSDGLASTTDDVTVAVSPSAPMATALSFNGTNQYVTFGAAPALGASTLTLELWFKRAGAGVGTSTGAGGIIGEPLLTKGRAQAEGSNVDMNYFLGIDSTTRVLVADFEDSATGANHPVSGRTAICDGLWYHAAATYDGTTWRLYLNGVLEVQASVGSFSPRADSIQHAALATAMDSTGAAAGFFNGTIDEARVWNLARTASQIASGLGSELTAGTGLIGRWGLNEGFGTTTEDSAAAATTGTLVNAPAWPTGSPFAPTPFAPGNYALDLSGSATAKDYLTFGAAPGLGATTFTLETWFKREGTGVTTSTGSGGVVAVPLIAKGMAEADGTNQDMNYFLGIRATDNVLVADFEDTATGGNHPIAGATAITSGVWHHVAATYDGSTWTLYLDGTADATLAVGAFVPRADSIQHATLGTALNSTGGVGSQTQGFFAGVLDEPRIWNYARSAAQVAGGMSRPIPAASGLLGRWSFDTICSSGLSDSSGNGNNGTLTGPTWTCVAGAPVSGAANQAPSVEAGPNQAVTLPASAALNGVVTDDNVAGAPVLTWSALSGPGTVTFGSPSSASTTASFSASGSYVLQLLATDGELSTTDTVTVTVNPSGPVNQAPVVDAGADQAITLPATASLSGTVNDDGLPGTDVTSTWSKVSGPGTVTFADPTSTATTASFSVAGSYVLQLSASDGALTTNDTLTVTVTTGSAANSAIDFGGTNAYVSFGAAPALGASTFTLELWFRRDGTGATANTGSGGINAVPLISKGRAQSDGSNVDMNYFFGISGAVLAADFEEGATGTTPGLNHPVSGVTPITNGTWYHAAATYDGNKWRLYLNGVLEAELTVGQPPRADSIQHAAIASALTSTGAAEGFFDGAIDEVRIWNYARTEQQIRDSANLEISSGAGLLARWGLNESSGNLVVDSTGNNNTGTIIGTSFARVPGTTFRTNQAPGIPVLSAPANGATGVSTSPTLSVGVTDADSDAMTVTFLGRPVQPASAPEFTIVAIPDTQHYVDDPVRAPTFTAQTQWIVDNRPALNIAFVSQLGDIVEHIDAVPEEWTRANTSLTLLDTNAFKWGLAPGNHDMNSAGVSSYYDLTFPVSRFEGNSWYGGYLGKDVDDPINRQNKNNYELFSVGGLDFVVIHLEYDMPDYAVAWADKILKRYPNRRAIIATHLFLNASGVRPTTVLNRPNGTPASTVWQQIITTNCNVFLVLNGHYPGEANRTDLNSCGQPVHQLASDYQSRTNGGDGWLRYMTFKPSENKIYVYTFSPTLNAGAGLFETDANSQFVLDYNMQGAAFTTIATSTAVPSGTTAGAPWPALNSGSEYEWYATASDGQATATSPVWRFTTGSPNTAPAVTNPGDRSTAEGANVTLQIQATDAENNTLTYAATGLPTGLSINSSTGLISGTVAFGASSTNNVTVTVSDASLNGTASFVWTVTRTNRTPVATAQSVTTAEETAKAITLTGSDPDADPLTFAVVASPLHGALTGTAPNLTYTPVGNYSGPDSFTFRVNDGIVNSAAATVSVTVTPTPDAPALTTPSAQNTAEGAVINLQVQASDPDAEALTYGATGLPAGLAINAATGLISGTIAFTSAGTYSVTVTVTDPTSLSASGTFTWTVTATNRAPVASAGTFTTPKNRTLTGGLTATDPDGDAITYALVAQARKGTATINSQTGAFTYVPAGNANGTDTFTFKANDGSLDSNTATVTIKFGTATANTPPVAANGTLTIAEDTPGSGAVTATDADGNTLSYRIGTNGTKGTATLNASTGAYTYAPQLNANGSDTFTFIANDGTSDSNTATITVTITAVNDPPVAVNDSATTPSDTSVTISVLLNDTDPEQQVLAVDQIVSAPTKGTALPNEARTQVVYTPNPGAAGTDTFTYVARDASGALSAAATVTVTILGANQPPVAQSQTVQATEDTPKAILLSAADPDGQPLTFTVTAPPARGTLTGVAPNLTYTPSANYAGPDTFTFKVNDGQADSGVATVTINIAEVNDAPVANSQTVATTKGVAVNGTLTASDVDGDALTFTSMSQPKKGTVSIDPAGGFIYTPNPNAKGNDTFTFRVSDGSLFSNTATVTVTIR